MLSGVAGRRDLVSSQSDRQQRKVRRARAAVTAQSGHDRRDMSSDIAREESFRTALRNQKRRLSATEKKPVSAEFGPGRLVGEGLMWLVGSVVIIIQNTPQVSTSLSWEVSRRGTVSLHQGEIS